MDKRMFLTAVPAMVAFAVPQIAMAGVIFGYADVDADVQASTDQQPLSYNDYDQSTYSTPLPIAVSLTYGADDYAPYPTAVVTATATTTVKADFLGAAQGTVDFTTDATATITPAGYVLNPNAYASVFGIGDFLYTFDVDTASILTVDYTTSDNGTGQRPSVNDILLPATGTGTLTFYIPPSHFQHQFGDDYLNISNGDPQASVTQTGAPGSTTGSSADAFSFTIMPAPAAVPETGTWLMMLSGFATIGFALRYRPRQVPRAA